MMKIIPASDQLAYSIIYLFLNANFFSFKSIFPNREVKPL